MPKRNNPKDSTPVRSMTQMNMRVEEETADTFRAFCKKQDLTQNAAMQVLLSADEESRSAIVRFLQKEVDALNETIKNLKDENQSIRSKNYQEKLLSVKQRNDWIFVMRLILNAFIDHPDEEDDCEDHLEVLRFDFAKEELRFKSYAYPEGCGCEVVYLDHLVYGKPSSPPTFVLGHTENQERIKLRWYPKKEFLGICPKDSRFAKRNSKWLMGYLPAQDGAVDLVAAIPLESLLFKGERQDAKQIEGVNEFRSLASILADAERRKNG